MQVFAHSTTACNQTAVWEVAISSEYRLRAIHKVIYAMDTTSSYVSDKDGMMGTFFLVLWWTQYQRRGITPC